jgi:hypothetical protein
VNFKKQSGRSSTVEQRGANNFNEKKETRMIKRFAD